MAPGIANVALVFFDIPLYKIRKGTEDLLLW